ncbi:hypothetical protein ABK040_002826 [Willaertia magna]
MFNSNYSLAAERNKQPILEVLQQYFTTINDNNKEVLEIASGTGQHITFFAKHFPSFTFQPTDVSIDPTLLESLKLYNNQEEEQTNYKNIKEPILFDVSKPIQTIQSLKELVKSKVNAILTINLLHISPWECTLGLLSNSKELLKENDGLLIIYGPFKVNGKFTTESNENFDISLKERNSCWGLRDLEKVVEEAERNDLILIETKDMPANNFILVFRRK